METSSCSRRGPPPPARPRGATRRSRRRGPRGRVPRSGRQRRTRARCGLHVRLGRRRAAGRRPSRPEAGSTGRASHGTRGPSGREQRPRSRPSPSPKVCEDAETESNKGRPHPGRRLPKCNGVCARQEQRERAPDAASVRRASGCPTHVGLRPSRFRPWGPRPVRNRRAQRPPMQRCRVPRAVCFPRAGNPWGIAARLGKPPPGHGPSLRLIRAGEHTRHRGAWRPSLSMRATPTLARRRGTGRAGARTRRRPRRHTPTTTCPCRHRPGRTPGAVGRVGRAHPRAPHPEDVGSRTDRSPSGCFSGAGRQTDCPPSLGTQRRRGPAARECPPTCRDWNLPEILPARPRGSTRRPRRLARKNEVSGLKTRRRGAGRARARARRRPN